MSQPNKLRLTPRPRAQTRVELTIPTEVYTTLSRLAAAREMDVEALIKLYVGNGIRQALSAQFAERILTSTAHVLARHMPPETIDHILAEIRDDAAK